MTVTVTKSDSKRLAKSQLRLFGSRVIGLASTAPVYSLVATLGFVSGYNFFFKFLFPGLGALLFTAAFVKSAIDILDPDYRSTVLFGVGVVFVIGVGSPLLMVVLMVVWAVFKESRPFFRGESLNEDTEVLVP
jgi:hypothetical protein